MDIIYIKRQMMASDVAVSRLLNALIWCGVFKNLEIGTVSAT
ncbi:hypothetical protein CEV32_3512 [Brucella rhizosphaerae]|uniref:Uncharacterized protein n=1 Tax=Brucella rhizosphaerae TaxID=571254 RepID=A0A256FSU4_9HYPH|nr:hypothetical protein CEV32_3512 [Brucella rhizosphaerae]